MIPRGPNRSVRGEWNASPTLRVDSDEMKRPRGTSALPPVLLAAALATLAAVPARGQADPAWLRMWREAQDHRPAELGSAGRIAPAGEAGTPLVVDGRVVQPDGTRPAAGVIVFAYQTDRDGIYFSDSRPGSPWRLQGWVRTDADGRFTFRTIRPGHYPNRHVPAHIHFTVVSPRYGRQWADSLRFADDPLLSEQEKAASAADGRFGSIRPVRTEDGVAHVRYTVRLKPDADF